MLSVLVFWLMTKARLARSSTDTERGSKPGPSGMVLISAPVWVSSTLTLPLLLASDVVMKARPVRVSTATPMGLLSSIWVCTIGPAFMGRATMPAAPTASSSTARTARLYVILPFPRRCLPRARGPMQGAALPDHETVSGANHSRALISRGNGATSAGRGGTCRGEIGVLALLRTLQDSRQTV